MVKEELVKRISCDVCHNEIDHRRFNRINIKGGTWDICFPCKSRLQLSLTFLTIGVGVDIKYEWLEDGK